VQRHVNNSVHRQGGLAQGGFHTVYYGSLSVNEKLQQVVSLLDQDSPGSREETVFCPGGTGKVCCRGEIIKASRPCFPKGINLGSVYRNYRPGGVPGGAVRG